MDEPERGPSCPGGAEPDLAAFAAADPQQRRRILLRQTARFATALSRWMEGHNCDGMSYVRLQVLEALREGPIIMRDLADRLGISARNTTALTDTLQAAGLVERHPHPTDRRATLVSLTEEGSALAATRLEPAQASLDRLFEGFSPDEQAQFLASLLRLSEALHLR